MDEEERGGGGGGGGEKEEEEGEGEGKEEHVLMYVSRFVMRPFKKHKHLIH